MFMLECNDGIITISYRNYAWVQERTLGIKDSAVLWATLSNYGVGLDLSHRDSKCVRMDSKAGMICRMYI